MKTAHAPYPVNGYVLAGGKSSRMGRDKALLELDGKPLVAHAVTKLERLCAEVAILSASPALASFGPLVADIHPGCGPLGGIHAALARARQDWCLILPVDVPFVPSTLLHAWLLGTLKQSASHGTRLSMFVVDGRPQPALLMIHRDLLAPLSLALARGDYRLLPALTEAAEVLAAEKSLPGESILWRLVWNEGRLPSGIAREVWDALTDAQRAAPQICFANLNTPQEFAEAQRQALATDR